MLIFFGLFGFLLIALLTAIVVYEAETETKTEPSLLVDSVSSALLRGTDIMKRSAQQLIKTGLLISTSLISSALILHFGLIASEIGLLPLIIAALAGGFLCGCLINRITEKKNRPYHTSWLGPLTGTIAALVPVIFIVCTVNLHNEFPNDSFFNKILGQYHDKISPLHKQHLVSPWRKGNRKHQSTK
jgi:hypothetical protein